MAPAVKNSTPSQRNPEDGIGERIRATRELRGLSQTQLHQRTKEFDAGGKGIARTVLIGYESGKFKPGARELRILCTALALTPEWLLLGIEKGKEEDLEAVSAKLFSGFGDPNLAEVFRLALVFASLKPHERESIGTLVHGLVSSRKGATATSALTQLAEWMALDAELRLAELTDSLEAAQELRSFKGKKLIEHFAVLYKQAYEERFGRSPKGG